jgi:hypothetical protein
LYSVYSLLLNDKAALLPFALKKKYFIHTALCYYCFIVQKTMYLFVHPGEFGFAFTVVVCAESA